MKLILPLVLLLVMLGGCLTSQGPFDDFDTSRPVYTSVKQYDQPVRMYPREIVIESKLKRAVIDPGVQSYVDKALANHPSLKTSKQRIMRIEAGRDKATSLPDPKFHIASGQLAETAAGQAQFNTGVSQKLMLPAKLETRGKINDEQVRIAVADYELLKLKITNDVRQTYWRLLDQYLQLDVLDQQYALLDQIKTILDSLNRVGQGSQQDILNISVEKANLDQIKISLNKQIRLIEARMNRLTGHAVGQKLPRPIMPKIKQLLIDLGDLLALARVHHPSLNKARHKIALNRQKLRAARLDYWPDLTLSLNYTAVRDGGLSGVANGRDQWMLGAAINLPIWQGKRKAAEKQALHGIGESISEANDAASEIAYQLEDAVARADAAGEMIKIFEEQIIPQAKQVVELEIKNYTAGKRAFNDVMAHSRKLLNLQLMQQRQAIALRQALADLKLAAGIRDAKIIIEIEEQPKTQPSTQALTTQPSE